MVRAATIALGVMVSLLVAGCSETRPLPTPTPSASASDETRGDGVLRVGTLFSMSGDVNALGAGMVAAVEVAVRDINASGGVLGTPVETFYRDAGTAAQSLLEPAFADLVARGVDVVIGPADAELAARLVPLATDAGVALISPATAISPPVDGVFSLIASAEAQARSIVSAIADGGAESVAIITASDAEGLAFDRSARAALADRGLRLAAVEQLDAATNPARLAFSVTGSEPDAIILAGASSLSGQNAAVLTALADRGVVGSDVWLTGPALADYSATVTPGLLEGAQGVRGGAPSSDAFTVRLRQSDPALTMTGFAPETYDAVVLAALAAELAGDDSGRSIAAHVREASVDGVPCASFGECVDVLITQPDVNYEGLSGPVSVSEQGLVADGFLSLFRYTAENRADLVGPLVAEGP